MGHPTQFIVAHHLLSFVTMFARATLVLTQCSAWALLSLAFGCGDDPAPGAPDATVAVRADATTTNPDATTTNPDATTTNPDAAGPRADAADPRADAAAVHPDAAVGPSADAGTPFPNYGTTPGPTPGLCTPAMGQTGNSENVGGYCTPGGQQCQAYDFAGICSIDVDTEGGNFCIHIGCRSHATCGEQGCCTGRPGGAIHACVPKGCLQEDMAAECPPVP